MRGEQGSVLLDAAGVGLSPPGWGRKQLVRVKVCTIAAEAPILDVV